MTGKFEVVGVANRSVESAKATAEALGLKYAYNNPQELIQSPEIDLVVVTVKVPYHFELVKAALEVGKHVYCEHPLGNGLEETKKLAAIAEKQGVVAVVGTQMVNAPEVLYVKQFIDEGYVGKVLSTTLVGSGWNWANETIDDLYYLFDNANGANMLTIPLGHTLAGLTSVLGDFKSLKASMFNNYTTVKVVDTGEEKPKKCGRPDFGDRTIGKRSGCFSSLSWWPFKRNQFALGKLTVPKAISRLLGIPATDR